LVQQVVHRLINYLKSHERQVSQRNVDVDVNYDASTTEFDFLHVCACMKKNQEEDVDEI
jgi:hypothetical protein